MQKDSKTLAAETLLINKASRFTLGDARGRQSPGREGGVNIPGHYLASRVQSPGRDGWCMVVVSFTNLTYTRNIYEPTQAIGLPHQHCSKTHASKLTWIRQC